MDQQTIYDDFDTLSIAAAAFIRQKILDCLQHQPRCRIALPGGNTPAACLRHLSNYALPWAQIEWYMGDERCLPVGHPERNDRSVLQTLFQHQEHQDHQDNQKSQTQPNGQDAQGLQTPQNRPCKSNFYPIKAELGAEKAAQDYQTQISGFDAFDIVLLGMGEDGHTASLFPNNLALKQTDSVVAVFNAPKPPAERVSLGLNTLIKAHCRIVLATGANKQAALERVAQGEALPINLIGPKQWFLDKEAMPESPAL